VLSGGFLVATILAALAAPGGPPASELKKGVHPAPSPAAERAPVDGKTLTKDKLLALPDATVVQVKGRTYTARELKALAVRRPASRASNPALKLKAKGEIAAARAAFRTRETSRIFQANAALAARFGSAHRSVSVRTLKPEMVKLPPAITSVAGSAEPGAALYVQGKNFGSEIGSVLLKGLPGGVRTFGFDPEFLFPWLPTGIAVIVPNVEKVVDQNVAVVVVAKGGLQSAPVSVPFKATRVVKSAFPVRTIKCGDDATDNACMSYDFFEGIHTENTLWETDGVGCDEFQAKALSPWEFESFQISNTSHDGRVGQPGALRVGDAYKFQVCWWVNGAGPYSGNKAEYLGYVMIKGPKGVPSF
jgi:hypothetical protein